MKNIATLFFAAQLAAAAFGGAKPRFVFNEDSIASMGNIQAVGGLCKVTAI